MYFETGYFLKYGANTSSGMYKKDVISCSAPTPINASDHLMASKDCHMFQ
jgi:hypothetical protein